MQNQSPSRQSLVLVAIKLLHTVIWFFFAACIVAIPFAAGWGHFRLAALLTGLVLLECAVLAANRCRCPLTDLAGPHTEDRRPNFDIYLPMWLARANKEIFGTLFVVAELFAIWRWFLASRHGTGA